MPFVPPPHGAPQRVAELIDPVLLCWDRVKLEALFSHADVELITSIPLGRRLSQDRLIWHFNKKGMFTTNSAYFVARDIELGNVLAPATPLDPFRPLWKAIWGATVPGKVAIHAWKCCISILPTRSALSRKGYVGDLGCLLCPSTCEDSLHLFVECPYANSVWFEADIQMELNGVAEFLELLLRLVCTQTKEQFAKTLVVLWSIWKNRNMQLWDDKLQQPTDAAVFSLGWLQEYQSANVNAPQPQHQQSKRWSAPVSGVLKCNADGAFVAHSRRAAYGLVFRNETGNFLAAAAAPLRQMSSPFHTEVMAMLESMRLAETLHYKNVIFESDCLLLIQALANDEPDISTLGLLLGEVRDLLRNNLEFKVCYTPREANVVAHKLAKHACQALESQVWFVVAPEFIRDALLSDYNH
ncbi:uncharacterized protein LOC112199038 [Rosa chinensis]|uniref:uncharacterized protein LOC112199038 n=1 Tax=Rosa chinensis TaxID=74649 RepID=UPI000D096E40|nr:uncharacterized protein LOC112199038 [Rosa chinensis]